MQRANRTRRGVAIGINLTIAIPHSQRSTACIFVASPRATRQIADKDADSGAAAWMARQPIRKKNQGAVLKLYWCHASTTCRPVVTLAAEAGVSRDLQPVDLFAGDRMSAEYSASHARRLVPMLADGDFRLTVLPAAGGRGRWPLAVWPPPHRPIPAFGGSVP